MNKEELIGKLQMVYVGDKNALNELICYYAMLKEAVELLKKENQKYKEVIDKAIEYIENVKKIDDYLDGCPCYELLNILKGEE